MHAGVIVGVLIPGPIGVTITGSIFYNERNTKKVTNYYINTWEIY